ncbi:unnamed protein product [Dracunculus medinensis]|uniref:PDZ domain-containing protein n=1 Tax=Dracunculus medinensis TaxID=318479 RepID=A0A0N4UN91_DRAME|nr:unnamed protein product [Dracunculus medinensis]
MRDYEEIEIRGERCVETQTSPISSENEEQGFSEQMYDCFVGNNGLNNVEYEEVILKRSKVVPRLGITLCYGSADDNDTDIFISEIERGSIADQDGRLRPGDQILQANFQ